MTALAPALSNRAETLLLNFCNLTIEDVLRVLTQRISPVLRSLSLNGNLNLFRTFRQEGLGGNTPGLMELTSCPIESLSLDQCSLIDEDILHLSPMTSLTALSLMGNKLNSPKIIETLFEIFPNLEQLDLSANSFEKDAAECLGLILAKNKTLRRLALSRWECLDAWTRTAEIQIFCENLAVSRLELLKLEALPYTKDSGQLLREYVLIRRHSTYPFQVLFS